MTAENTNPVYHYAIVDIGSNSIKMTVAHIINGSYHVECALKESLRLLESTETIISEEKIEQLFSVLIGFEKVAKRFEAKVEIIATSAMRRAENTDQVKERVLQRFGRKIEVLSGDREADLVFKGHQAYLDLGQGTYCIVDIGGGSVEMIGVKGQKKTFATSLPLGTVVLKKMFEEGPWTETKVQDEVEQITKQIKQHTASLHWADEPKVVLSGGNPKAVSEMCLKHQQIKKGSVHQSYVYRKELKLLLEAISDMPCSEIQRIYQVDPQRADLIKPTIVLLMALLNYCNVDFFQYIKTGIREGRILEICKETA